MAGAALLLPRPVGDTMSATSRQSVRHYPDPGADVSAALQWLCLQPVGELGLGTGSTRYILAQGWATRGADGRLAITDDGRAAAKRYGVT